jgi:predicted nucleic acid-binding protein
MIRVVVDTNVLVSVLLTEHGAEAEVLALIVADRLIWCVS